MKHYTVRMQTDLFGPPSMREAVVHNVFFGLMPDPDTRAQLSRTVARLQAAHRGPGRWVKPERYHMTLHFLGSFSELPQERVDAAQEAAQRVKVAAFELSLDRVGHFSQGIGWLGCRDVEAPLQSLWSELHMALAQQRVPVQGHARFVPHVTVLRDARTGAPDQPIPPIVWPVREFALIDSVVGKGGDYRTLARWPLALPVSGGG